MAPIQHANFTFNWKIGWPQFSEISTKKIVKQFITPRENVVFRWRAELSAEIEGTPPDKFGFSLFYEDGPLTEIKDVYCVINVTKTDNTYKNILSSDMYEAKRNEARHWANFSDMEPTIFQNNYGLTTANPVSFHVTTKIPLTAFSFRMKNSFFDPRPLWISDMFKFVDDRDKSQDFDVQLIASDDKRFFCHKIILHRQSEGLAALFRNATTEEEKSGVFRFPTFRNESLNAVVEFLYAGKSNLDQLETSIVIEVADFSEQYQVKELKEKCACCLWDRVEEKTSEKLMKILRFADLHDEKYLKDRALEILAKNYEKFEMNSDDFFVANGTDLEEAQGEKLLNEFIGYILNRLDVWFG